MFKILQISKALTSISKTFLKIPKRNFTDLSSLSEFKNAQTELREKIKSEIQHEEPNQERQDYVQTFLKTYGWEMECSELSTRIILSKTVENCSVKIFYDARYPSLNRLKQEQEQGENLPTGKQNQDETNPNNEESTEPDEDFIEFFVLLDKGKEDQALFDMFVVEGEAIVNGMIVSPDIKSRLTQSLDLNRNIYQGPKIVTMEEDFQEKIYSYLTAVGITNEFAQFIEESAFHHENNLYLNFMKKVNEFLA